jgi:hypothetical protein
MENNKQSGERHFHDISSLEKTENSSIPPHKGLSFRDNLVLLSVVCISCNGVLLRTFPFSNGCGVSQTAQGDNAVPPMKARVVEKVWRKISANSHSFVGVVNECSKKFNTPPQKSRPRERMN